MLLELGRLRVCVVSLPFSVGADRYEDSRLVASSDSHDSLQRKEDSQKYEVRKVHTHTQSRKSQMSISVEELRYVYLKIFFLTLQNKHLLQQNGTVQLSCCSFASQNTLITCESTPEELH